MKNIFLLLFILTCKIVSFSQSQYPLTKTVDSTDTYFGASYPDPYRWLENLNDTSVKKWYNQQADLTNDVISKISGRDELIKEWEKLEHLSPTRYTERNVFGNKVFYLKTLPKESSAKLYYKENSNAEEQLIFDPATSLPDKEATFQSAIPSSDCKKIIITSTRSGSEVSTISVFDIATKTFMSDVLFPCMPMGIYWNMDNTSIIYTSLLVSDNKSHDFLKNNTVKLHKLGTDQKFDIDFFSNVGYPELNLKPHYLTYGGFNVNSPHNIFANIYSDDELNIFYTAPISQLNSKHINWKVLSTKEDKLVSTIDFINDKVYAISSKNALNYKLLSTSISTPNWSNAEIIAPEKKELILSSFVICKDFIVLTYFNGINKRLFKYNITSKITSEIKLPYIGTAIVECLDNTTNTCYVTLTSRNKPTTEFKLDVKTNVFSKTDYNDPTEFPDEYKNIEVEEIEIKGHDGVMIPLSIMHKKGLKLDGSNVCFMQSYGSYGYSMLPTYDIYMNSLVVKGIVVAIPHVRGGGEKGEAWQKAGMKTTKPNTWKDFNSCAEYLISKGYTSAKKIVGSGASAGGIMIGRAVTERPDLYGAAISNVGVLNTLRSEKMPNGKILSYHFGTLEDSVECKALYEMDALAHIKKDTSYPAFICVTGWNDMRVSSWQSGKFVAAMQNANSSKKPILLKINYEGGHFGDNNDYAGFWAFALWQCGHPDFQLKK